MKTLTLFLSVSAVLTASNASSDWKTLKHWTDMKAYESCFGEDLMKQYTVNMKKAVAKCSRQDAPELNLPPFRSTYRFVNTLLSQADEMENQKMMFVYKMMENMNNFDNNNRYGQQNSFRPFSNYNTNNNDYNVDSWMEKMMKKMMMKKMMNKFEMMFDNSNSDNMFGNNNYQNTNSDNVMPSMYSSGSSYNTNSFDEKAMMESMMKYKMSNMMGANSGNSNTNNYREKMMQILSRNRRQAGAGQKDTPVNLPSSLDVGDRLTEKVREQQRQMEAKIGNMTCVLRETGILNEQNVLDARVQKNYMKQYDIKNKWLVERLNRDIENCVEIATNLPQDYMDEMNFPGYANMAQIKHYMKCIKVCKMKTCMYRDVKEKLETNFGPLDKIVEQTQMSEDQLLPLVMNILHGDEMEFDY